VKTVRIAALMSAMVLMAGALAAQPLRVVTEDAPPLGFTENGHLIGSSTAVVREVLRRLNLPDHIEVLPWARAYEIALTQPDVVLYSTTRIPEREALFHWVGPLCTLNWGFYARKGSKLHIASMDDARKVNAIGTYRNDAKEQVLRSLGFSNLDSAPTPDASAKKLMAGRVDLWLTTNLGMPEYARKAGVDPAALEMAFSMGTHRLYIAMSRQTPEAVVSLWQQTLDAMKKDGSFRRLSLPWISEEALPSDVSPAPKQTGPLVSLELYTEDSPPGSFLKGGKPAGVVVDLVREILRRLDQHGTISLVPWVRGYTMALNRPNTAVFATTRLPVRETLFQWVGPVYQQHWGFYAKKGSSLTIRCLDDAKKISRIGSYAKDAKREFLLGQGFSNLVNAGNNTVNIKHLMAGRIDLMVSSDFNMPWLMIQAGFDPKEVQLAYGFRTVNNYIAFSLKTDAAIVNHWQQVLEDIKQDGTYERIFHVSPTRDLP
jgi:polar amino acid transport system substrate-binding protein